eukprot:TRINITY_DN13620_c0_g1_i1.p1 TRINITY_DN13620_c0_g1~~TRINITY_DN13620_c0_g1_i1.p1  ORF type:complete len:144 (+),score=10.76 TRINITY_DN13620_c0_g1_i1:109-540(+)
MALVSRLCAVLATSVWSTLRADALFAERAERGDNDATATDALGRVLVRREPAVRLRANCSSVNGSQPLVAADDGCDCGNSTACVEGQFCLQTASLCFGACSAPAGGGTIDYLLRKDAVTTRSATPRRAPVTHSSWTGCTSRLA